MISLYVRNKNNNIIELYGNRHSFRCRQRNRYSDGKKVESFKFISYKSMLKDKNKWGKQIYSKYHYNTLSKL